MALTPEDVVNKRFNPTKFREGYDQDEVDDFLDEVVVELRRLNAENEELRQRLVAGESRINELNRGGAPAAAAPTAVAEPAAPAEPEPTPEPEVVAAPEPVAAPAPTPITAAEPGHVSDTSSTNNLLQLARRLHEEHVREGIEKRDALIAEGHATAARVVSEAQEAQRAQLGALEEQKAGLESQIEELRAFEGEYRAKLKSYIEGQLRELDAAPPVSVDASGSTPSAATGSTPTGSAPVAGTGSSPIFAVPSQEAPAGDYASATTSPGTESGAQPGDRSGLAGS